MPIEQRLFLCDICYTPHHHRSAAVKCEEAGIRGQVPGLNVGDFVETNDNPRWVNAGNGEPVEGAWINPRTVEEYEAIWGFKPHGWDHRDSMVKRAVTVFMVTAIDTRDHDQRYHLFCGKTYDGGTAHVWNVIPTHCKMRKLRSEEWPAGIIHEGLSKGSVAQSMIGKKSGHLL